MQQPKWFHGSMRGRSGSWWLSGVGVVFGVVAKQTADQDNPSALSIPPFFTAMAATCSVTGPPILSRGNGVAAAAFSNGRAGSAATPANGGPYGPPEAGALAPAAHLLKASALA